MTPEDWKHVADGFQTRWNFPNCLGAMDGKHVVMRPPPGSGSYYYFNYKGSHSIVLMAICDANSEFIYLDVGTNGRVFDGGVWDNSAMSAHIANGTSAGLPDGSTLPGSERSLPFVFVADDAFSLQRHIMKPFPHRQQSSRERIYSYERWKMHLECLRIGFASSSLQSIYLRTSLVLACTSLHNFLRRDQVTQYTQPDGSLDSEDLSQGTIALLVTGEQHQD